jgi:tetratricopeptide (TPR) repeat protein
MTVKYDDVSSERVHKELTEYYKSKGELNKASTEYLAIAYLYPLNTSYYYYAADLAYKANDYENTLIILNQSPNPDSSSFAQMTFASIFYSQKKYKEALLSIDKLENLSLTKEKFLFALQLKYKIQRGSGLAGEAEKTLALIKKLDPNFSEGQEEKALLVVIP